MSMFNSCTLKPMNKWSDMCFVKCFMLHYIAASDEVANLTNNTIDCQAALTIC